MFLKKLQPLTVSFRTSIFVETVRKIKHKSTEQIAHKHIFISTVYFAYADSVLLWSTNSRSGGKQVWSCRCENSCVCVSNFRWLTDHQLTVHDRQTKCKYRTTRDDQKLSRLTATILFRPYKRIWAFWDPRWTPGLHIR